MSAQRQFMASLGVLLGLTTSGNAVAEAWNPYNHPMNFDRKWHPMQVTYEFDRLPLEASTEHKHLPWGDSYWPMQRGGMSYRWQKFQKDPLMDQDIPESQRKRVFFERLYPSKEQLLKMSSQDVSELSPMEKYSIYIGDYSYKLAKRYTESGFFGRMAPWERESWEGYCNPWTQASLHYKEPDIVVVKNKDGIELTFGSGDIKALLIANYSVHFSFDLGSRVGVSKRVDRPQIGQRCQSTFFYPTTKVKDGREVMAEYGETQGLLDSDLPRLVSDYQQKATRLLKRDRPSQWAQRQPEDLFDVGLPNKAVELSQQKECQDVNAGTFHLITANMIGLREEGFGIDKTRDAEVWNQPVYKYSSEIVSESGPLATSSKGTVRTIRVKTKLYYADDTDYGWTFFHPTQKRSEGFEKEYAIYQRMLMRNGDLEQPEDYPAHLIDHADYEYTLDLDVRGRIIGGDWLTLDRPDFMWIMERPGFVGDFEPLKDLYRPIP